MKFKVSSYEENLTNKTSENVYYHIYMFCIFFLQARSDADVTNQSALARERKYVNRQISKCVTS